MGLQPIHFNETMSETGHVTTHASSRPHFHSEGELTGRECDPVWAQIMDCLTTYVQDHKILYELLAW